MKILQTCAAINFGEQRVEYYDSLGGVDNETINSLLRWVEDEYADKYKKPLPERLQVCNTSSAIASKMSSHGKDEQHKVRMCRPRTGRSF